MGTCCRFISGPREGLPHPRTSHSLQQTPGEGRTCKRRYLLWQVLSLGAVPRPLPGFSVCVIKTWELPVNRPSIPTDKSCSEDIRPSPRPPSGDALPLVKLMMAAFSLSLFPYHVCATVTDVLAALSILSQAVADFRKCSSTEYLKRALILQVLKA